MVRSQHLLLLGPDGVYSVGELLGLGVVGKLGLHPDEVGVGCEGNGAVDGSLAAALVPVVTLTGTGSLPVKVDVDAGQTLSNGTSLLVALALALLEELLDELLFVDMDTGIDGVDDGLVEELQVGLLGPGVLNSLELGAILSGLLSGVHEFREGLEVGVGGTHDVVMVAGVDGGGDEGGSFGVSTGDGEEVGAHDISLGTDGNQAVDVLADRDKHLSGHVAALLRSGSLILNVNTSSTLLDEKLGELHNGSQATVTGIGISNDGAEEVGVGDRCALLPGCGETLLALLPVMEELCEEEMCDFVGDSGLHLLACILAIMKTHWHTIG